jgi:hypothetical protein
VALFDVFLEFDAALELPLDNDLLADPPVAPIEPWPGPVPTCVDT